MPTGQGTPLIWCHEFGGDYEEPGLFNQHVGDFIAAVESGRWGTWARARR